MKAYANPTYDLYRLVDSTPNDPLRKNELNSLLPTLHPHLILSPP
jgi:hypothetical protein